MNRTAPEESPTPIPSIRLLRIERFRGIEGLEWRPAPGLNVIVGPGDSCKSTILEAIEALLSPAPYINLSEFDYFQRQTSKGFMIEAALAIGDASIVKSERFPLPPLRGWHQGQLTDLPDENGAEAVMVCRLTGTPDQDVVYEVVGADEETRAPLSRALRQRLGLMRLAIADRWDRDLRLVQGGALDRYMEGQQLRQSILQAISNTPIHDQLGKEPKEALGRIDRQFRARGLPCPVRLGLVGTPGVSLAASVGLMVGPDDSTALPLPAWGTGTRRLASLELASILADRGSVIAVVDEPESGLEPYRQRAFVGDLNQDGKRQAFITTHAPAVLSASAALSAVISRVNLAAPPARREEGAQTGEAPLADVLKSHELRALDGPEIAGLLKSHPEAILAHLPVICEGITEEGFATRLLIGKFGEGFSVRGIFCVDGGGHDRALAICKVLLKAGFRSAAVADDEGRRSGSWEEIGSEAVLLRWENGASLERAVIGALPDDILPEVVAWPEEFGGREARHCLPELRRALGAEDRDKTPADLLAQYGRDAFVAALFAVACPPREGGRKPKGWFKSFDGGFLLADKLLALDPPPTELTKKIAVFLNAVEGATTV
ncbi:MAG: AAA family ATPase [Alphaproteobacteria bacterium]|nr:AAA family ATPase [Alphaproteobacteria bacterium]